MVSRWCQLANIYVECQQKAEHKRSGVPAQNKSQTGVVAKSGLL